MLTVSRSQLRIHFLVSSTVVLHPLLSLPPSTSLLLFQCIKEALLLVKECHSPLRSFSIDVTTTAFAKLAT